MLAETLAYLLLASVVSMFPIVIAMIVAWADKVAIVNFYEKKLDNESLAPSPHNFYQIKSTRSSNDAISKAPQFLLSDVKPLEMISDIVTLKNVVGQ